MSDAAQRVSTADMAALLTADDDKAFEDAANETVGGSDDDEDEPAETGDPAPAPAPQARPAAQPKKADALPEKPGYRSSKGQPASKPIDDEDAPPAKTEPAAPAKTESAEDRAKYKAALQVLSRAQVDTEGMSREQIMRMAAPIERYQAAQDRLGPQLGTKATSRPTETTPKTESGEEPAHGGEPGAGQPSRAGNLQDFAALVQPVLADFGLDADKEAGQRFAGLLHAVHEVGAQENAALRTELANLQGAFMGTYAQVFRQKLLTSGRYPQLEDDARFAAIETEAVALLQSPAYAGNVDRALKHAVKILEGDGQEPVDPVVEARQNRSRERGTIDVNRGSTSDRQAKKSEFVSDEDVLGAMAKHGG